MSGSLNNTASGRLILLTTALILSISVNACPQSAFDEMLGRYKIIFDSTSIWPDGRGGYDYHRKFISEVILDEEGRSVLSRPATPILNEDDKISVSAYTRLASGAILNADESDMITRTLPGNRRWIFVNFRQAEPGATLHLEWLLESKEANIAGKRFLGRTVPVDSAYIIITVPESWKFNFAVSPSVLFDQTENIYVGDDNSISLVNHSWKCGNIPGISREEFLPPQERLIPCLYYSFYYDTGWTNPDSGRIDWNYLARLYSQQLANFSRASASVNSAADSISNAAASPRLRAQMAYDWLGRNFTALESDIALSDDISLALQRGRGTQAEAAAILLAMLDKLEIDVSPHLVATRDVGDPLLNVPALFWFDRLLLTAHIESDTMWIDPYYKLTRMDILPFEDIGARALDLGSPGAFSIIPITDYHDNGKAIHLKLAFDSTGSLQGDATEIYSGAMIPEISTFLQSLEPDEKSDPWLRKLAKSFPNSRINRFVILPPDSSTLAFRIGYSFTTGPLVRPFANRAYIPMDLLGRWADLPALPSKARQFPIELRRSRFELERITFKIQPPFEIEFLPSNFSQNDEIGEIYSVARGEKNSVTITRGFGLKRPVLPVADYGALRRFLGQARTEADKHIILKRVD